MLWHTINNHLLAAAYTHFFSCFCFIRFHINEFADLKQSNQTPGTNVGMFDVDFDTHVQPRREPSVREQATTTATAASSSQPASNNEKHSYYLFCVTDAHTVRCRTHQLSQAHTSQLILVFLFETRPRHNSVALKIHISYHHHHIYIYIAGRIAKFLSVDKFIMINEVCVVAEWSRAKADHQSNRPESRWHMLNETQTLTITMAHTHTQTGTCTTHATLPGGHRLTRIYQFCCCGELTYALYSFNSYSTMRKRLSYQMAPMFVGFFSSVVLLCNAIL